MRAAYMLQAEREGEERKKKVSEMKRGMIERERGV